MSRFVRASKFRHVFGQPAKNELCYENTNLSRIAWDSNYIKANNKFFAMLWQTAGGGAVGVVPYSQKGKLPQQGFPLITGHKQIVLEIDWHPFNDYLLASVSEDCLVKLWSIPETGLKENLNDSVQTLKGHKRKVGTCNFHPTAPNLLATSSQDFLVKGWDIEKGSELFSLDGPKDLILCFDWNRDGSQIAITCKDKKVRTADPRSGKFEAEWECHQGVKGSRCMWLSDNKLLTVGFGKTSDRQYAVHDPRNNDKPLVSVNVDNSSGMLMPFYDVDTQMVYMAGKGDGFIRYWEYVPGDEKLLYVLSEYKSNAPNWGMALGPKTLCAINECEVARIFKVEQTRVTPVSMICPRKSDLFQDDIYPDTSSGCGIPSSTIEQWMSGANEAPKTISLKDGFVAKPKSEDVKFEKKEEETGPKSEAELRKAYEEALNRIKYLETEIHKRDLKLKELETSQ